MADNLIPLSSLLGEELDQDNGIQLVPLSSLMDQETGLPANIPGARRVFIPGIDPTHRDELDIAISGGDRFKFAAGQFVRSISNAF